MTIGVIGNVFRGMFDFEFDRTKVRGALGPEVLNIQLDHLGNCWEDVAADGNIVEKYINAARQNYQVEGVGEADLAKAARLAGGVGCAD